MEKSERLVSSRSIRSETKFQVCRNRCFQALPYPFIEKAIRFPARQEQRRKAWEIDHERQRKAEAKRRQHGR